MMTDVSTDQLKSLERLKFDAQGLIPAVVQDRVTREVLMMAWMNAASLEQTLRTGETWFWSRSRQELWHKGATSGHTQRVTGIRFDCDGDTLLVEVEPAGPACHTGAVSCFYRRLPGEAGDGEPGEGESIVASRGPALGELLESLLATIAERERTRPEKSYTTYLFNQGIDKILKKVGEEAAETIIAAKNAADPAGRGLLAAEISDLLYHLLVLMVERKVGLDDIADELAVRAGRPALPKYDRSN